MACPFFMPTRKLAGGAWLHPSRLPLGAGWHGLCTAHAEAITPTHNELEEFCNLGYASRCRHLPQERLWDAVRFSITRDCGERILLGYVCEFSHLPREHGTLEYAACVDEWVRPHPDLRIQRMAECHLESYLQKARAAQPLPGADHP